MILRVDPASAVPPFEQVRAQVADLVAGGALAPGTRLPTVRQLAGDLGLAPGTVARAFRELEDGGVVVTRGRHGTFVADMPPTLTAAARRRQLHEAAVRFAAATRQLGVPSADALAAARAALGDT